MGKNASATSIQVSDETADRLYHMKGRGTSYEESLQAIFTALDATEAAARALEGESPDIETARAELERAMGAVDE